MTLHRRGKKRRFRNGAGSCFAFWESRRLRISIRIRYPADKSSGVHVPVHLQSYPLLLADEPTGALDSLAAQALLETFTEMNKNMGQPF